MIEKNIFMSWIGDEVPESAQFSFDAFKNANPSFNCEFVVFSINEPGEWRRRLPEFDKVVNNSSITTVQKNMRLSIQLRYYLIQTYGGIYLDADMFPIKEFDDNLITSEVPFKMSKIKPGQSHITDDCGFMGCQKGTDNWTKRNLLYPIILYDYDDDRFLQLKEKFFNKTITFGEHYNDPRYCYVDHYDENTMEKKIFRR